jgi:hypothetical protein
VTIVLDFFERVICGLVVALAGAGLLGTSERRESPWVDTKPGLVLGVQRRVDCRFVDPGGLFPCPAEESGGVEG